EVLVALAARAPATPGLSAAMLQVARDLLARREARGAHALLARIVATWPGSADADKANALLAVEP
ncbi:hypothetical protein, partial [Dokdonella sp.]|uniref:hypothetical protein n=1 Tax=Dokdonella sp. TaxID=2291710 RepID=UPI002F3F513C